MVYKYNGAHLRCLGQPEAGTTMGTQITSSQITQSCTARLHNRQAHNDSLPVECPRGPLSMCVTTSMYVAHMVCTVFLLLYPCCYMIYGLLLNYDSSTQARLSFYTSWWHTHVAIIQLIHTTYVLQNILQMQNTLACTIPAIHSHNLSGFFVVTCAQPFWILCSNMCTTFLGSL